MTATANDAYYLDGSWNQERLPVLVTGRPDERYAVARSMVTEALDSGVQVTVLDPRPKPASYWPSAASIVEAPAIPDALAYIARRLWARYARQESRRPHALLVVADLRAAGVDFTTGDLWTDLADVIAFGRVARQSVVCSTGRCEDLPAAMLDNFAGRIIHTRPPLPRPGSVTPSPFPLCPTCDGGGLLGTADGHEPCDCVERRAAVPAEITEAAVDEFARVWEQPGTTWGDALDAALSVALAQEARS